MNPQSFGILNPYAAVDWSAATTYKANLHTHTDASDGEPTLTEMVEAYYRAGYDILALTDHGVINRGWTLPRKTHGIFNGFRKVSPMSAADYDRITRGTDRGGRGMTDITGGVECNMAVLSKVHVNGYFTEWGDGVWGKENDYATAALEIDRAGGYSVLNHVGDWVNSNHFPARSHAPFYILYFARILLDAPSCLGLEIVNNTDNVTRADRALWDELLRVVIPRGRNVWAFADDDSEKLSEVGRSFELFPLRENTLDAVREAMRTGAFFAASRFDKTDRKHEFEGDGLVPLVKEIRTDEAEGTITVVPDPDRDCREIRWISEGRVVSSSFTLRLRDAAPLGSYVRFQLHGAGGVTYSQPFELRYEGRPEPPLPQDPTPAGVRGALFRCAFHTRLWAIVAFVRELNARRRGLIPRDDDVLYLPFFSRKR